MQLTEIPCRVEPSRTRLRMTRVSSRVINVGGNAARPVQLLPKLLEEGKYYEQGNRDPLDRKWRH